MNQTDRVCNVVIATPGLFINASYVLSLSKTLSALSKRGMTWKFITHSGPNIYQLRNVIHRDIVENDIFYDKVFWIDSDISWKEEDFLKLLDSEKDIVSAAYMLNNGELSAIDFNGLKYTPEKIKDEKKLIQISANGMGFMAMKYGILERMDSPFLDNIIKKRGFDLNYIYGEDVLFCMEAQKRGFDVWLDPTVRVDHHKTMPLKW